METKIIFQLFTLIMVLEYVKSSCIPTKRVAENGLKVHNYYRLLHGVDPLEINDTLTQYAQKYAEHLADTSTFVHSLGPYGENLFCFCGGNISLNDAMVGAVEAWYSEIKYYDFNIAGPQAGAGHFTQVVWKSSTLVGMGAAIGYRNGAKCTYVVANYSPAGNWFSKTKNFYAENVLPKLENYY